MKKKKEKGIFFSFSIMVQPLHSAAFVQFIITITAITIVILITISSTATTCAFHIPPKNHYHLSLSPFIKKQHFFDNSIRHKNNKVVPTTTDIPPITCWATAAGSDASVPRQVEQQQVEVEEIENSSK